MEVYRDKEDFPTILYTDGKLGIINIDFLDMDECLVTCTNDMWHIFEERFSYICVKGKHFFMSRLERGHNFSYIWDFRYILQRFQAQYISLVNNLLS